MADIGSRVATYREELKACIVSDSVLSRLQGIIPQNVVIRLRQLYDQDRPKATGEMLDILEVSDELGKWKMFIDALKEAEYPYLVYLLETATRPSQNYDHERKLIQLFWPQLASRIDPAEFVSRLYAAKVIEMEDMQAINSKHNNVGSQAGAVVLLERIQCRREPEYWYETLLDIMMKNGLDDLVKEMEPDIYTGFQAANESRSPSSVPILQPEACGSVRESVLSDSGEAYMEVDNLNPPDVQQDSVETEFYATLDDSITQDNKTVSEMKLNVNVADNRATKVFNIAVSGQDDIASDEFHDAVVEPEREDMINKAEVIIYTREEVKKHGGDIDKTDKEEIPIKKLKETCDNLDREEGQQDNNLSSDDEFWTEENVGSKPIERLKLRNYQLELAEKAIKGDNTIICAETGSGKTWVALHIVKKHLERNRKGKVVFMAKYGTLTKQQADRFKIFLPEFETKRFTGEDQNSGTLFPLLECYHIFCMTPQILLNNLDRNSDSSLASFSLLIFDECHHTKKDDPYNKVMRRYLQGKFENVPQLPQVVGLTASLGVGKAYSDADARDYIIGLCANLDAKNLSTVERYKDELKQHVNVPKRDIIPMKQRKNDPCNDLLQMTIRDIESKLDDIILLNSTYVDIMNRCPSNKESQDYTKWTIDLMKTAQLSNVDDEESRNISTCAKYLSVLNAALEVNSLLLINDVQKFLSDRLGNDLKDNAKLTEFEKDVLQNLRDNVKQMRDYAKGVENPNVRLLSDTLKKMLEENGEDSRAMVFVKQRATCKRLAEFLDKDLAVIGTKVRPLYGKENRDDEEGMTESRQNDTVENFRAGEYKVLVTTSVGSEGIDVPDCNIVLSYNYTGNEIQRIQMAGRSRKKGGAAVVLGDEKTVQKETMNAFKADMMYRAMELLKHMPQHDYDRKVRLYQKQEFEQLKRKRKRAEVLQGQRGDASLYEIKCARCNAFACYSKDIRILADTHHIVVDKGFADRIRIKTLMSPKTFDGMTKKSKIYCKNCPLDWGIVLNYCSSDCWTLKLACLKFVNTKTRDVKQYKKWNEVPFIPTKMETEDLM